MEPTEPLASARVASGIFRRADLRVFPDHIEFGSRSIRLNEIAHIWWDSSVFHAQHRLQTSSRYDTLKLLDAQFHRLLRAQVGSTGQGTPSSELLPAYQILTQLTFGARFSYYSDLLSGQGYFRYDSVAITADANINSKGRLFPLRDFSPVGLLLMNENAPFFSRVPVVRLNLDTDVILAHIRILSEE